MERRLIKAEVSGLGVGAKAETQGLRMGDESRLRSDNAPAHSGSWLLASGSLL
jgi:hypothetical protein